MKRFVIAVLVLAAASACNPRESSQPAAGGVALTGAARGAQLINTYGCNVCHTIPGVEGPQGTIGPSLAGVASRPKISNGTVATSEANLTQFIQNPSSLNPQSSMPPNTIPADDVKDIVAYLLTLK